MRRPSIARRSLRLFSTSWGRCGLLAIGVLLLCNVKLLVGRSSGIWDASEFFCPHFILVADHARHGEFLLWTPLIEGGSPTGFDPEVGAFSPFVVGLAALLGPHERAFCLYWLLLWGLGGLGVLMLARHYRAPPWLGCAASIGYMFSATFTNQAEYTTYLTVMAMLPWVLWRLEAAVQAQRLLPAVEAGALWGLTALSGYPALIIIGYCYLALWMCGRVLCEVLPATVGQTFLSAPFIASCTADRNVCPTERSVDRFPRLAGNTDPCRPYAPDSPTVPVPFGANRATVAKSILIGIVFVAVSLPILSPAYLGFLRELRGYSDRSGVVPRSEAVAADALDSAALSTFASPYLARVGKWEGRPLWSTDIAMCGIYLAPALVVLAFAAPWMRWRDGFRWWLAGMALLCIAAALGDATPVRGWLYDWLPPMRYFRHAAMFRCFYMFSLVVLAILAGRDLEGWLARMSRCTGKTINGACGGADILVCPAEPDKGGRQECLPHRDEKCGLEVGNAGRWNWLAAAAIGAAVCAAAVFVAVCVAARLRPASVPTAALAAAHLLLVWGGAAAIMFRTWRNRWRQPSSFGRYLVGLCIADAVLTVVLSQPTLYCNRAHCWAKVESAHVASVDQTAQGLMRLPRQGGERAAPLETCLVDKLAMVEAFNPLRNALYDGMLKELVLADAASGADRIWFASAASVEPLGQAAAARLAARAAVLGRPCLILSDPASVAGELAAPPQEPVPHCETPLERLPAAVRCAAKVRRYTGRTLEFNVSCPKHGWLLVTDRWAPGWRAWVNDVPQRVWIGNLVFRAVPVRQGENRIRFQFCPWGYPWLLLSSWLTLGMALAASVAANIGRSRSLGQRTLPLPLARPERR